MDHRSDGHLRIGELSRRTGVTPELLRAWERRYALLRPARSSGGFRLYSAADEARVHAMRANLARGVAAAEAARLAAAPSAAVPPPDDRGRLTDARSRLSDALASFEGDAAHAVLDGLFAMFSLDAILCEVVLPYLHDLGDRWERGDASVAQEHFASNLLRGRLLAIGRGWDRGIGPRAVLACLPGELHDLGLIAFALALRERGWRVTYLGPDTPLETVSETAAALAPRIVVLTAVDGERLNEAAVAIEALGGRLPLALAGAGSIASDAAPSVRRLDREPVAAAELLTREVAEGTNA